MYFFFWFGFINHFGLIMWMNNRKVSNSAQVLRSNAFCIWPFSHAYSLWRKIQFLFVEIGFFFVLKTSFFSLLYSFVSCSVFCSVSIVFFFLSSLVCILKSWKKKKKVVFKTLQSHAWFWAESSLFRNAIETSGGLPCDKNNLCQFIYHK